MKGSIGTSTGIIINTRNKKPKPANCKLCKNGRNMDGNTFCMLSGSTKKVNRQICKNYIGPYIQWQDIKINKRKGRKKNSNKGSGKNAR